MPIHPNKEARRHVVADAILNEGLPKEAAEAISSMVPDFLTLNAAFINPKPFSLEILSNGACFIRYDGKLIYICLYHFNTGTLMRAGHSWTQANIKGLEDDLQAKLNVAETLWSYNPENWALYHSWYDREKNKLKIDLTKALKRAFMGVSDETIH